MKTPPLGFCLSLVFSTVFPLILLSACGDNGGGGSEVVVTLPAPVPIPAPQPEPTAPPDFAPTPVPAQTPIPSLSPPPLSSPLPLPSPLPSLSPPPSPSGSQAGATIWQRIDYRARPTGNRGDDCENRIHFTVESDGHFTLRRCRKQIRQGQLHSEELAQLEALIVKVAASDLVSPPHCRPAIPEGTLTLDLQLQPTGPGRNVRVYARNSTFTGVCIRGDPVAVDALQANVASLVEHEIRTPSNPSTPPPPTTSPSPMPTPTVIPTATPELSSKSLNGVVREGFASVDIPNNSELVVQLYGFDSDDGPSQAQIVDVDRITVSDLPAPFTVTVPPDSGSGVTNSNGRPATNVEFFLTAAIDIDHDGRICQGDFQLLGEPLFFNEPPREQVTLHVARREEAGCVSYRPS